MIIYKTTNLINNKIYIGQSKYNNCDYLGSGSLLKKAIKKYGKQNFKKEIIEYCHTKEHLNEREIYWIDYYNSRDSEIGYNLSIGGCGNNGFIMSLEARKKISLAFKGKNHPLFGKKLSKSTKELISKSLRFYYLFNDNPMKNKGYLISKENHYLNKMFKEERIEFLNKKRLNMLGKNKGKVPWNKGKRNCYSKESLQIMSVAQRNNKNGQKNYYFIYKNDVLLEEGRDLKLMCFKYKLNLSSAKSCIIRKTPMRNGLIIKKIKIKGDVI
jgi:group I intron endonuclease